MRILVVNRTEVEALLPVETCIDRLESALVALARGQALLPLRQILWKPDRSGALGVMPATLEPNGVLGAKVISVFPGNLGTSLDTHQGAVLLFEADAGRLLAIVDAGAITAIRTAAASALATKILAREDARVLAILGSGVQARSHLEAMLCVRRIAEARVWSRDRAQAGRLAAWGERFGLPVRVSEDARDAVTGADIVCTVTGASEPILHGAWVAAGTHINAVGACTPNTRELDTEAVRGSRLFTDRRESLFHEAGDFVIPFREGAFGEDHLIGELGQVLIGEVPGRTSPDDITLFKSLGIAVEDVAAAHEVHHRAVEADRGTWIELGGERPEV